jgi:hypothetical protein
VVRRYLADARQDLYPQDPSKRHAVRDTTCNRNLSMVTFYKAIPVTTGTFLLPIHTGTDFLEYQGSTTLARLAALDLALDH